MISDKYILIFRKNTNYRKNMDIVQEEQKMKEKILTDKKNGMAVMIAIIAGYVLLIAAMIYGENSIEGFDGGIWFGLIMLLICLLWIPILGLKVLKPEEALVLTLFGNYVGTIKGAGFYFVNPFCTSVNPASRTHLGQSSDVDKAAAAMQLAAGKNVTPGNKISMKIMTLNNGRQKVNDCLGNPIDIGVAVMWKVKDTAKAVFNVDNYKEYLSLQCDSAVRNIVKIYPYDVAPNVDTTGDGQADDGSLRGSSEIVAGRIRAEIQSKVAEAGLEIVDARITYLAYSPEIAAVMLQRQQASAVIDARKMIVDGAVGMVEMALEKLKDGGVVELDEERKANMVSNLLTVLCSDRPTQPVVNTGTLY